METISKFFGDFISGAERLGTLSATAVWAFFTLLLVVYFIWDVRNKKDASELAWNARLKDAETDGMMANAVEKLAEQIKELRYKIRCIGDDDDKKD